MTSNGSFVAPRWLSGRHAQTVVASLVRMPLRLPITRERWHLPDGDFLDVDRLPAPTPEAPYVIICHGLEGSSRAGYVRGLLQHLAAHGLGAAALNFRSCSGEPNRLPRFYHSGETGDLQFVIERLSHEQPARRLGLAGFSLGGNVVAKYLGERGEAVPPQVVCGAVVSVPFDLAMCARALDSGGLMARVYRERFLRRLRAKVRQKAAHFPSLLSLERLRAVRSFRDFDEHFTAPLHGFIGADDYWSRSSSGPLLGQVRRPLLILAAEDDPFVPPAALPRAAAVHNPYLTLEISRQGGHVAFVAGPPWKPLRFAEQRAAAFLAQNLA